MKIINEIKAKDALGISLKGDLFTFKINKIKTDFDGGAHRRDCHSLYNSTHNCLVL